MLQNSINDIWKPKINFFKNGKKYFSCPYLKKEISWSLQTINLGFMPITLNVCEMRGPGEITARGYGLSIFFKKSLTCAFAEAWERMWMMYLITEKIGDFSKFSSSNGFSAGETAEKAIASSKEELIERFLFLKAWQEMQGWILCPVKSIKGKILCSLLFKQGWHVRLFRITDQLLGGVLVGLAQHKTFGSVFDCIYIQDNKNISKAELKVISSIIKSASCNKKLEFDICWELPDHGKPTDHGYFYRNPDHVKAFEFLEHKSSQKSLSNIREPLNIQSELIFGVSDFPALAVSYCNDWPQLRWGKQAIKGKNPWPHPLA